MRQMTDRSRKMVYIALCAALMAVCAMITIPSAVPFTLQTFGVFFTVLFLGGKQGLAAILVYLAVGALGLPVFAGFGGGIGVLFGPTGGYLLGFLLIPLADFIFTACFGEGRWVKIFSQLTGLACCYGFGTGWFMLVSANDAGFLSALALCVLPFLVPDLLKLALAFILAERLRRYRGA